MKLSEAIRLGAVISEQTTRVFEDSEGRTCAMGSARRAIGKNSNGLMAQPDALGIIAEDFPLVARVVKSPCRPSPREWPCELEQEVFFHITHLNDFHRWTREQIADWVETIEPKETAPEVSVDTILLGSSMDKVNA